METSAHHLLSVEPEILGHIFGYPISNTFMGLFLLTIFVAVIVVLTLRSMKKSVLSSFVMFMEMVYEAIVGLITMVAGKEKLRPIFPLIATLFTVIFLSNIFGMFPGLLQITYDHKELFRVPTSDFNVTLALALSSLLMVQVFGARAVGVGEFVGKYLPFGHVFKSFRKGITKGFLSLIDLFVGVLELIGEVAKSISLSLRLFGNIFAGEVLIGAISSIVAIVVPSIWVGFNLLVAVVQTIVFTLLVIAYYSIATTSHAHEENTH